VIRFSVPLHICIATWMSLLGYVEDDIRFTFRNGTTVGGKADN
jgi:hypothetical protein